MDEYNKYAALANTIKIEDITTCERKQSTLYKIKDNDPSLCQLWICNENQVHDGRDYSPDTSTELAWLGYFLGSNSNVKHLHITNIDLSLFNNPGKDVFFRGLGNNTKLSEIEVNECQVGAEGIRQLSLAIGECNHSLKHLILQDNEIGDGHLVDVIAALSMHPQLEQLDLTWMEIGINGCTALSTLLRCTTTRLQKLNLHGNNIDDEGVEVLVNALANINTLRTLNLSSNRSITITGWTAVSTLLEVPSSLEDLTIHSNNFGDDEALVLANALANNSTLKLLDLDYCQITHEGWAPFSKLLCDTSSVKNTYLSNHTLHYTGDDNEVENVIDSLGINGSGLNKQQVAMSKITQHHSHFNMEPFFEWEFKVLPIMINWFTRAASCTNAYEEKIEKMKLSILYDFIREFPMLYIEPMTRKEIAKYTAKESSSALLGNQVEAAQSEEIRQCKARAMRRVGIE